jgi:purine-binding chemotaxis protein CheW
MSENDFYDDDASINNKYLTFFLEKESYGIDIRNVIEIIGIQEITKLPDMPDFVKGIINLRGKTFPVMDLRLRFRIEPIEYGPRTCIIIVNIDDNQFGFIVDTVSEVLTIDEEAIDKSSANKFSGKKKYISGIGKVNNKVIIIIDINKILSEDELAAIDV